MRGLYSLSQVVSLISSLRSLCCWYPPAQSIWLDRLPVAGSVALA